MRRIFENQNLNSTLLRGFLAISKHKNLTRAASEICCTQSTLSLQLKRLEAELDAKLFIRNARGMQLTDQGKMLLPIAEAISEKMREIGDLFNKTKVQEFKIGIPDDLDGAFLEISLSEFAEKYPETLVSVSAGCTTKFEYLVRQNELDMAIVSGRQYTSNIPFSTERNIWVCKRGCSVYQANPVRLALPFWSCWWCTMITDALRDQGLDWQEVYKAASYGQCRSAIMSGRAVGVISEGQFEEDLQELDKDHGYPPLPDSYRSIIISESASQDKALSMCSSLYAARNQTDCIKSFGQPVNHHRSKISKSG